MNVIVLFFSITVFLIPLLFSSRIKGFIGEKTVSSILYLLDSSKYKVINNVVLNVGERTSQIDHVIVSDFGVFVIETKNYKGWIVGGERSEYWTQVLFKRKEKFYNPIRQNFGHITALKNCLHEFPHIKYISIIVFSAKAEIKVNTTTELVNSYRLLSVIKKYSDAILKGNEKERIFQQIKSLNLSGTYKKREHIKSIKQRIQTREDSIRERKCPQCGAVLILRKGKFGDFLGCGSYPGCKFTRNI